MQIFERLLRRAPISAFVYISVSAFAPLTACSSSDSDDSSNAADTTGSSGGNDSSGGDGGSGGSDASGGNGTSNDGTSSSGNAGMASSGATGGAAGADQGCSVDVASHEPDEGLHVTECSHIDYSTNPPSSGKHYDVWAAYQTYDFPVPRGYWVHALEHGGVVISYNCPDGCADEVAQVESLIASLPADPRCTPVGLDHQVIITPDPLLDTRWAMSSWGKTLRASCIDEAAFQEFYESNTAFGPEDICGGGRVITEETLAPNCGE